VPRAVTAPGITLFVITKQYEEENEKGNERETKRRKMEIKIERNREGTKE
jgi:hypothetical protein